MEPRRRRRVELLTAGASGAAGLVHGGVTAEHFREWWGYGLFFVVAASAQMALGLALLTRAVNAKDSGPGWWELRRRMLLAGMAGTLAIMALYVVTRTVGIPFFGPEAGVVEDVAPIDVLSKLLEAAVVVGLGVLVAENGPSEAEGEGVRSP